MDIVPFLKLMVDKNASDLFFSTGAPVHIKVDGRTTPVGTQALAPGAAREIAYALMSEEQQREFEETLEMNLALMVNDVGRFRVNVFRQRDEISMVVRYIKDHIPAIEELGLPLLLKDLAMERSGLVLVVGSTGSGKSTTLASMIDHRNRHACGHILTVEDPIEFLHGHKKSIVNQREVGFDTHSYGSALKNAMREAPDVILIGEIRDRETMQHAISYAETGHLCLSTLHANNADQTLDRIVNFFPDTAHRQLFVDLSLNLRAIVSLRLVQDLNGKRVAAVEVLDPTPYVVELIRSGDIGNIKKAMERGDDGKSQTFDQALFHLYEQGRISREEALRNADSKNNLSLKIQFSGGGDDDAGSDFLANFD